MKKELDDVMLVVAVVVLNKEGDCESVSVGKYFMAIALHFQLSLS